MKKNKKKKKLRIRKIVLIILLFIICIVYLVMRHNNLENLKKLELDRLNQENYKNCLLEKYNDNDKTVELINKENEIVDFLKKNLKSSVYYYNPNNEYYFKYNDQQTYYAASTIKMLDAIYIYEKAINHQLSLDEEIIYQKQDYREYSTEMSKYKFGDKVSLKKLVEFTIKYSDNTAHKILVEYIGINNLKEYGKSLGATKTLVGTDYFGNINTNDSMIYIKKLDEIFNLNTEISNDLKSFFIESEENYLKISKANIAAATKYGNYNNNFHNNGIVLSSNPYYISILTNASVNTGPILVQNINEKIYELHELFYENRKKICYQKIYEK